MISAKLAALSRVAFAIDPIPKLDSITRETVVKPVELAALEKLLAGF